MGLFDLRRLFAARQREATPFARGLRALARGRDLEAEAAFSDAAAGAADDAQRAAALNKRGVARVRLGRREEAALDFFAALALVPLFVAPLVNVGNLLLEEGVLDDAVAHYEAALRIDDDDAAAHLNLSVAFKRLGERAKAVHHLRRSHRLELRSFGRKKGSSPPSADA